MGADASAFAFLTAAAPAGMLDFFDANAPDSEMLGHPFVASGAVFLDILVVWSLCHFHALCAVMSCLLIISQAAT